MKLFGTGALHPAFGRAAVLIFPLFVAGCAAAPLVSNAPGNSNGSPPIEAPAPASIATEAVVPPATVDASTISEPIEIFSPAASAEESERDPAASKIEADPAKPAEDAPQRKASSAPHGKGDNWFLRDLPVLRIKFPEDGSAVEGVHYKKVILHRCTKAAEAPVENAEPAPASVAPKTEVAEPVTTAYYPGRNLEAIEVQLHGHTLSQINSCTTGAVDINPEVALAQLLKSSPTALMYPSTPGHVTAFSRTSFNQSVESSFDVNSDSVEADPQAAGDTDEIFVPTSIDPSDRVYVAAKEAGGAWRLILPVAGDIPLKTLSEKLALVPEQADTTVLDLLASSSAEETSELSDLMAKTWSMLERTSDDLDLRDSFYSTYRIPLRIGDEHTNEELKKLTRKFTYKFASSDASTSEIFHTIGERKEFVLSRSGPMWRAIANLVHQTAHSVQNPGAVDSADLIFRNEMDAQLKQDAYLKHISLLSEGLKMMIENYNSIAAVASRRVRWADAEAPAGATSLCEKVIETYALDRTQIAPASLQAYSCPVATP